MTFTKLKAGTKIILIIQSIAMLSGTATHLLWVVNNGFLSENYKAPFFSMLFWDSLTFLDPVAALLLITRPKTGIWLTAAIITIDVIHNTIFGFTYREPFADPFSLPGAMKDNWMLLCQISFGIFVLITLKNNLKEVKLKTNGSLSPGA